MSQISDAYENRAAEFLQDQGLEVLARNFHCKLGELDLVCSLEHVLVFVEVRYRSNSRYGGAAASVTPGKQRKLIRAAQVYLQRHPQHQHRPCRFDGIALSPNPSAPNASAPDQVHVQWLPNAFTT